MINKFMLTVFALIIALLIIVLIGLSIFARLEACQSLTLIKCILLFS